jgi:RNA polymerase sigma-70 factor (ECF subfamily)
MVTVMTVPKENNKISLERLRCKDIQEYDKLLNQFGSTVYSVCLRILGHVEDAEDALQETFLRFYQNLSQYNPSYPLKSWLIMLARHTSLNILKKRKVGIFHLGRYIQKEKTLEMCDTTQGLEHVQHLVRGLKEPYRSIVVLKYTEKLSDDEIAQIVKISANSVRVYLYRALSEIRRRFKK